MLIKYGYKDSQRIEKQIIKCNDYIESHANEIIALFENEPTPAVTLTWLIKASELLWVNPKHQTSALTKLEKAHDVTPELRIKLTSLLLKQFIQIKQMEQDQFFREYDPAQQFLGL